MIKSVSKYIPLKTLIEIKENQYRTKCGQFEFCSFEVDQMIYEKQSINDQKKTEKLLKQLENQFNKAV